MPQREGKCTNFGLCTIADSREAITLPDGEEFSCLECGKMLAEVEGKGGGAAGGSAKGSGKSKIALAGLAVMLLAGGGYFLLTHEEEPKKDEPKQEISDTEKKLPEEIKKDAEDPRIKDQQIKEQQLKEQQAKEQQFKEQQALLQQQRDQLKREQDKINQAELEAKTIRSAPIEGKKAEETEKQPAYAGPSSVSIVWEGTVNGPSLLRLTTAQPIRAPS